MPGEPPDDRGLLDRLNALKPTSIALDKSANPSLAGPPGTFSNLVSDPLEAREDALSVRLRTLRNNQAGGSTTGRQSGTSSGPVTGSLSPQPQAQPPRRLIDDAIVPLSLSPSLGEHAGGLSPPGHASELDMEEDIDALLASDEVALDELLEGLECDSQLSHDEKVGEPANLQEAAEEARKVEVLLEKLQKTSGLDIGQGEKGRLARNDEESDDEGMALQIDQILAKARDEAELEQKKRQAGEVDEYPDPAGDKESKRAAKSPSNQTAGDIDDGTPFALPGVPSTLVDPAPGKSTGDADTDPFSLPTVPSQLVDPAPETDGEDEGRRKSVDFENDITVRLAALKGLGAGINTDSFGLPSAPTFHPEDRPVTGVFKKPGYTDEDQKTWCIVCLEDATIRCMGCDDDVYCARCFKDMHVGPRAGYEERGHKWVKFEK